MLLVGKWFREDGSFSVVGFGFLGAQLGDTDEPIEDLNVSVTSSLT